MGAALLQIGLAIDPRTGLKYVTHASASSEVTHQMIRSGFRCDAVSRNDNFGIRPHVFVGLLQYNHPYCVFTDG